MADYSTRLRPGIELTSPEGNAFTAKWRGNESPQAKKVGIFNYPKVAGSTTQDLNVESTMHNIPLFFDGPDNDLEAARFMSSLKETGVWDIVHPVLGLLKLQPLSFSPNWQPVTSGNITEIETDWIEPIGLDVVASVPELQAQVSSQIITVNETASEQFEQSTFQEKADEVAAFRAGALKVVSNVEEFLESISKASAIITAEMESIKRDLNAVLAVVPLDVIAVAGQLQELIQLPARAIEDVAARLDAYANFAAGISLTMSPDIPGTPSFNTVAIQELALTAAFGAVADVSSTGVLLSRSEAVGVIEANLALFTAATNALDATQVIFENQPLEKQYFSQSQSYGESSELIALTVAYLLAATFNLKTEKRFILDRDRNPVMVTIEEYGSMGDDDSNNILFNDSNKIEDDEHLLMLKGREVVVYV